MSCSKLGWMPTPAMCREEKDREGMKSRRKGRKKGSY